MKFIMNDSERNKIILRVASKIQEDGTSHNEQDPSIMEQYTKYVISLDVPESDAQEIVAESFLYLQMKSSSDEDPLQKGDTFGVGFS